MTLDEAIKHCEELVEAHDKLRKRYDDASGYSRSHNEAIRTSDAKKHEKCNQDFRQLTEWLKELKELKNEPCEDAISRADVIKMIENAQIISDGEYCGYCTDDINIDALPSVTPKQKTGKLDDHGDGENDEG